MAVDGRSGDSRLLTLPLLIGTTICLLVSSITVHALWGRFLGLFPPVFLTDEVEGLDPKNMQIAGGLAIICLVTTLLIVLPIATSTTISAWSDWASLGEAR